MKTIASAFLALWSILSFPLHAAAQITNESPQAMMHEWLKQEAIRLDKAFLDGVTSRQGWEEKRPAIRQEYLEMMGLWPLPERTPLRAQTTGVIERESFRVEKVHFQSRPGLYVTANLYLPKGAAAGAKLPAVLYVCGHSGRGRDGNKAAFQHHGIWFAEHGYACLIVDTLQLGEIAAIHHGTYRHDRWWWQARGYTPAGVECWNGIRAIDYLQGRPEVDGDKIAVTGISGGGAATFWIAAADDRVKVAVPVSGMSDLEDYVGDKVVNGHCDCMFLINTFQQPWTHIAALVAPRPLLFANSGHDTIFPMPGNERIRARLEKLYGFYTNRTDRLFDIAVTPGGHEDNPELRLMAYRWINRFLKDNPASVTEPEPPRIEGVDLRVFPTDLPSDEVNTRIDESFVPLATHSVPTDKAAFALWQKQTLVNLDRLVFRGFRQRLGTNVSSGRVFNGAEQGTLPTELGIAIPWKRFSSASGKGTPGWLVVLDEDESLDTKPAWLAPAGIEGTVVVLAPRGSGPMTFSDPAPFYIQRAMPLLGRTLDDGRVYDVLCALSSLFRESPGGTAGWNIAGRGRAGMIAAYAALLEPRVSGVTAIDPPTSHRAGPIFLNVLRVLDVPDALGLLAPRELSIFTPHGSSFEKVQRLYQVGSGAAKVAPMP